MTKTKYSISAASRLTGKSRTTIAKHLKAGKLSCSDDETGAKLIDASELIRVYDLKIEDLEQEEGADNSGPETTVADSSPDLAEKLAKEVAERDRERKQYEQQIEHLKESLQLAQEGHNRATLLLESNQGGGGWQEAIEAIERRIANQEAEAKTEREKLKASAKRQIDHYKQQLHAEQAKTFWQRVFG